MTSVVAREGTLEDQDRERLGKGKVVAKDLQITHPTNASTISYIGNNTKEPTTMQESFGPSKIETNFVDEGAIIKKKKCALGNWSTIIE